MSAECDETRPKAPGDELGGLDQAQPRGKSALLPAVAAGDIDGCEAAREIHWEPDPGLTTSKVVALFLLVALERLVVADEIVRH
jgi:hypothetical protein